VNYHQKKQFVICNKDGVRGQTKLTTDEEQVRWRSWTETFTNPQPSGKQQYSKSCQKCAKI